MLIVCGFTDVRKFGPVYRCTVCGKEMTQQWMDWIVWNKLPLPKEETGNVKSISSVRRTARR
jgi:hypothetical protein